MLARKLAQFERREIESALELHAGNVEAAAREVGIPKRTLYDKLARLGIAAKDFRRPICADSCKTSTTQQNTLEPDAPDLAN